MGNDDAPIPLVARQFGEVFKKVRALGGNGNINLTFGDLFGDLRGRA